MSFDTKIISCFKYRIGKRSILENKVTKEKVKCKTTDTNDIIWTTDEFDIIKRYAKKAEWKNIPDIDSDIIRKSKIQCCNCRYEDDCYTEYTKNPKCKDNEYNQF